MQKRDKLLVLGMAAALACSVASCVVMLDVRDNVLSRLASHKPEVRMNPMISRWKSGGVEREVHTERRLVEGEWEAFSVTIARHKAEVDLALEEWPKDA